MLYIGIIGSEGAGSYEVFRERCLYFLKPKAAQGITIAATEEHPYIVQFARDFGLNIQYYYTNWKTYGKNALKERNKMLISGISGLIYFNDGLKDSQMIVKLARDTGIPVKRGSK